MSRHPLATPAACLSVLLSVMLASPTAQAPTAPPAVPPTVRAFFLKYQDRLLYGTDQSWRPYRTPAVVPTDAERAAFATSLEQQYRRDWAYYAGSGAMTYGTTATEALGLPREVLEKFYWRNAERLVGVD